MFACGVILCAGIVVFVTMCAKDEECKKCENKSPDISAATFCGDELKEAERPDSQWKNCK